MGWPRVKHLADMPRVLDDSPSTVATSASEIEAPRYQLLEADLVRVFARLAVLGTGRDHPLGAPRHVSSDLRWSDAGHLEAYLEHVAVRRLRGIIGLARDPV